MRVEGVRKASSRLRELRRRVGYASEAIVREAGETCLRRAKQLAPVRTGRLRESIELSTMPNAAVVEAKAPYAGFVEHGTKYARPRPYMAPAVREAMEKMAEALERLLST